MKHNKYILKCVSSVGLNAVEVVTAKIYVHRFVQVTEKHVTA